MRPAQRSGAVAIGSGNSASGNRKSRLGNDDGGKTAVAAVARELGCIAQILPIRAAIFAAAAGFTEPRNSHPLTQGRLPNALSERLDASHDLMARNDRISKLRELTVDDVQIGAAHRACFHPDANLARLGFWIGALLQDQGSSCTS